MSRRSARNRHRHPGSAVAVKARTGPAPYQDGATFTGPQLAVMMQAAQQAGNRGRAALLERPPEWMSSPFPPGHPLAPAPVNPVRPETGRAEPRLYELPVSSNINIATAPFVPWRILDQAADLPLFRKCIERRKNVADMDFAVVVDPRAGAREALLAGQHEKDVEAAMRTKHAAEIVRISDFLVEPDPQNNQDWAAWGKALMENRLRYDAAVVYPHRTWGGDVALRVITGKTIKPLLDDYACRPGDGAVAFQQILYGFPRSEFTATVVTDSQGRQTVPGFASDELIYDRTIWRPESPYGMPATEIALLDGILWMRRFGWMMAEYTEGTVPEMYLETSAETDWSTRQWEAWLQALNDGLAGNTAERLKLKLFPPGVKAVQSADIPERYKPEYDMFLIKLVAGDFGMTATEIGFPEVGSLGASFHEGEEDVLNRVTRVPDANWLGGLATRACVRFLGMPPVLRVKILGLESEDEAAADTVAAARTSGARMTLNEDRARRGEPPYDFPEADMPMIIGDRGLVFVEGSSKAAPPGTLIMPASVKPGQPGDSAGPAPDGSSGGQPDPEDDGPAKPTRAAKALELAAYRRWAAKRPAAGRQFVCKALTAADAPELVSDPRIVLAKAGDSEDPKVLASSGTGRAGSGTRTS